MVSWREKSWTIVKQVLKFCLLRSVSDYMSVIFVYWSSLSNSSILISILVKKEFLLNRFTFIFSGFFCFWVWCGGGYWWQNDVNSKVLTGKVFSHANNHSQNAGAHNVRGQEIIPQLHPYCAMRTGFLSSPTYPASSPVKHKDLGILDIGLSLSIFMGELLSHQILYYWSTKE